MNISANAFLLRVFIANVLIPITILALSINRVYRWIHGYILQREDWGLIFGGIVAVYLLLASSPAYVFDALDYMHAQSAALEYTFCQVDHVRGGYPLAVFGVRTLYCKNDETKSNEAFYIWFSPKMSAIFQRKGTFYIGYTPRARVVVRLEVVNGP